MSALLAPPEELTTTGGMGKLAQSDGAWLREGGSAEAVAVADGAAEDAVADRPDPVAAAAAASNRGIRLTGFSSPSLFEGALRVARTDAPSAAESFDPLLPAATAVVVAVSEVADEKMELPGMPLMARRCCAAVGGLVPPRLLLPGSPTAAKTEERNGDLFLDDALAPVVLPTPIVVPLPPDPLPPAPAPPPLTLTGRLYCGPKFAMATALEGRTALEGCDDVDGANAGPTTWLGTAATVASGAGVAPGADLGAAGFTASALAAGCCLC